MTTTDVELPEKNDIEHVGIDLSDVSIPDSPVEVPPTPIETKQDKASRRPPILLEWKDITFKVPVKAAPPPDLPKAQALKWKLFRKQEKVILHPMSGYVAPGHVLAIMGPSGAGTFLK